jgi:hypothetical protein
VRHHASLFSKHFFPRFLPSRLSQHFARRLLQPHALPCMREPFATFAECQETPAREKNRERKVPRDALKLLAPWCLVRSDLASHFEFLPRRKQVFFLRESPKVE